MLRKRHKNGKIGCIYTHFVGIDADGMHKNNMKEYKGET